MKDKILALLKTKFVGVSDAIINRVATKMAETVITEDSVTTSVEGLTLQQVIDSYTDSRATEATQSAVKNFREKHGLTEDGKLIKKADVIVPPVVPNPDEPAWFTAFKKQQEEATTALNEKLNGYEKEKTATSRTATITAKLKEKGIPESYFKGRNLIVESEDNIDQLIATIDTDYTGFKQEMAEQGVIISVPKSSTGGTKDGDIGKQIAESKNTGSSNGVEARKI